MNTIIFTSIALAVASTTSFANGGSWLELDQDIASLSSTINMEGGAEVGALLRSSYRDGDGAFDDFGFEDVLIHASGSLEEFSWRVSADLTAGLSLDDANVSWNQNENLSVTWGQQKLPMFRSSSMDQESMLFIDRSEIGAKYDNYDMGVSISGSNSGLDWTLAAVNGNTAVSDDLLMFAHVDYAIGNGASSIEGALHAGDGMDGTIGVSYSDQQDDTADAVLGIDLAMTMGQFSLSAELEDQGDDGDSPNAVTLGYLFADNMEIAFRHEDRDTGDSSLDTFGFNYYMHGHNAKWAINYIADDDDLVDEVLAIGLTVGASR